MMLVSPPQQTVTDMANRDLSNELNRTHRRVGAVIKRVETLVQEVEELRQTQEALVARVGVTATTGRVDPVAVSAVEGKIERLRGEGGEPGGGGGGGRRRRKGGRSFG